jgi:hypothetical protein
MPSQINKYLPKKIDPKKLRNGNTPQFYDVIKSKKLHALGFYFVNMIEEEIRQDCEKWCAEEVLSWKRSIWEGIGVHAETNGDVTISFDSDYLKQEPIFKRVKKSQIYGCEEEQL